MKALSASRARKHAWDRTCPFTRVFFHIPTCGCYHRPVVGSLRRRVARGRIVLLGVAPWVFACVLQGCSKECVNCDTSPTEDVRANPTSGAVAAPDAAPTTSEMSGPASGALTECQINEDCPSRLPVCSLAQQCVACESNADCGGERPYCKVAANEKNNRCIACQKGTDCGEDGQWLCIEEQCFSACDPSNAETSCRDDLVCVTPIDSTLAYCAECGPETPCADPELLCVNNTCLVCDPAEDLGCSGDTPHCDVPSGSGGLEADGSTAALTAPQCVECRVGPEFDDCATGVCVEGACAPCSPSDGRGCGGETPICTSSEAPVDGGVELRCVQCDDHDDCAGHPAGEYCVENACASCDLETDAGCSSEAPACVNVAPPEATALYECRECDETCAEGVCLEFECVECATSTDCASPSAAECSPENTCVPCTTHAACETHEGTPFCDNPSGVCVACRTDDDCTEAAGTPACDPAEHKCVECTNDSHCPEDTLGCLLIPGPDQRYTCLRSTTPGALEVCSRCGAGDCPEGLGCARSGEDSRCLPLADDSCTAVELFSEDLLGNTDFCRVETCIF